MMALITASSARCRAAGEGLALLGVAQQDVQELVAEQRLDLGVGAAVLADEVEVDQQPRPLLAGHRQRRHRRSVNSTPRMRSTARMANGFSSISSARMARKRVGVHA